ncbi:restriction endonuclease [Stenotrophomonas sp. 364]|uniref:restriction endonuclease n=1 Tax=Stenotrophomonas sp. 364 TaxID=2691571 RepID=UPI0013172EFB|nr:restriction endonuclease [Stenotrophomonas sp. 364]QHB71821.1 restriction endonuclease [Stenotrophomonas sp. 364]
MGRRRTHVIDVMATWPWYINVAAGALGFAALRMLAPQWHERVAGTPTALIAGIAAQAAVAWLWLGLCLLAAIVSWAGASRRRRLLDTRTGLESLSSNGWRDFERLVGEAYRRQGYTVEETGLGGADGGIDLVLRRDGKRTLVQCKQWRRQQVGVSVVREMYGLLAHHRADAVLIVSSGAFTRDAQNFIVGKPITLVAGEDLLGMIQKVQARGTAMPAARIEPELRESKPASERLTCKRCSAPTVERRNRRTGDVFMGCSRFPACRG